MWLRDSYFGFTVAHCMSVSCPILLSRVKKFVEIMTTPSLFPPDIYTTVMIRLVLACGLLSIFAPSVHGTDCPGGLVRLVKCIKFSFKRGVCVYILLMKPCHRIYSNIYYVDMDVPLLI